MVATHIEIHNWRRIVCFCVSVCVGLLLTGLKIYFILTNICAVDKLPIFVLFITFKVL